MQSLRFIKKRLTAGLLLCALAAVLGCTEKITADPLPPQGEEADRLLLVVHGLGDSPQSWPSELIDAVRLRMDNSTRWDMVAYDWSDHSEDSDWLTASYSGLEIGRQLGTFLASAEYSYGTIHIIAHSVGSFVIHGAVQAYRKKSGSPARIHMTYLDPFTLHGVLNYSYGRKNFGRGADFAEMIFNSDDPVPSTNIPLDHAHNFDITGSDLKNTEGSEAHWWPVDYYITTIEDAGLAYGFQLSPMATGTGSPSTGSDYPAGETTVVN